MVRARECRSSFGAAEALGAMPVRERERSVTSSEYGSLEMYSVNGLGCVGAIALDGSSDADGDFALVKMDESVGALLKFEHRTRKCMMEQY